MGGLLKAVPGHVLDREAPSRSLRPFFELNSYKAWPGQLQASASPNAAPKKTCQLPIKLFLPAPSSPNIFWSTSCLWASGGSKRNRAESLTHPAPSLPGILAFSDPLIIMSFLLKGTHHSQEDTCLDYCCFFLQSFKAKPQHLEGKNEVEFYDLGLFPWQPGRI